MAGLLGDPGFDLVYGRTGSVFIPRDHGPQAIEMIQEIRKPPSHNWVTERTALVE
jgi:hypothetical protein